MRERAEQLLKILCAVLVALLLWQTGRALVRSHPFARVTIPAMPALSVATNAPAEARARQSPASLPANPRAGTNQVGTNLWAKLAVTNLPPATNRATHLLPLPTQVNMTTHAPAPTHSTHSTNLLALKNTLPPTNAGPTGANGLSASVHRKRSSHRHPPMMGMLGMGFMPGMGGPSKPLPELPPVVRARIDTIVNSELLGPIIHPLPMALLGIAGDVAFLRADSGETGLVKEGDTLGDLKLLRIGINRVLIEQNGQKQELTIFDGIGGESLLTNSDKNPHENTNH